MNKTKIVILAVFFSLTIGINMVRAEVSSEAYTNPGRFYDQQVFSSAYNNTASSTLNRDSVVIMDIGGSTANSTLGANIIPTQVSDSIFVFGITDETCAPGRMCRICIRGPHKVVMNSAAGQVSGQIIGSSTTFGTAGWYSTADGTAGGQLGMLINTTATSDTGDASNTYWAWINPRIHK